MPTFYFSEFPMLETDRLVLRQMRLDDAEDVLVYRGDAHVQRFNSEPLKTVEQARDFIAKGIAGFYQKKSLYWGVTIRGEDIVIGGFGFNWWDAYHRRAEVGYDLARAHWGHGYATEALTTICRFGFDRMDLNRIETETLLDNTESVHLLKRLGFHHEGTRRAYSWEYIDNAFHDGGVFGLLKGEFKM